MAISDAQKNKTEQQQQQQKKQIKFCPGDSGVTTPPEDTMNTTKPTPIPVANKAKMPSKTTKMPSEQTGKTPGY